MLYQFFDEPIKMPEVEAWGGSGVRIPELDALFRASTRALARVFLFSAPEQEVTHESRPHSRPQPA
jgi:hypothetical protein